jgi:hypothetical protein
MAQHRRVEPRGIIGTGMAADVDRIRDVEADKERKERAWRDPPERGFGDVLATAPAKAELEDEPQDDPRKRRAPKPPEGAPAAVEMAGAALAAPAPVDTGPSTSAKLGARGAQSAQELPKVAPDPRERLLRAQLARNLARPKGGGSSDTPPTGSHARKPTR